MVTGEQRRPPVTEVVALASLAGIDPTVTWWRTRQDADHKLRNVAPEAVVSTPLGSQPIEQLLSVALIEPVVHGWDLATATGQPAALDPEAVAALLPGVLALGDQLSASGMYRPPVEMSDDAPEHDRLLAALGRTPRRPGP